MLWDSQPSLPQYLSKGLWVLIGVLNLPHTWDTNCISLNTFCCPPGLVLLWGGEVLLSGLFDPFPLASQNICSLSMSWVVKLLWGKTHLGESLGWHLGLVHTTAQRQGEQRTGRHLCSQQQHGQTSLALEIE